ncbi:MAG TPA: metallopeptidase family protein [Caulobacteraceae bacterium]|jgi:predicted Zn-dependent protease with MMP-like domain|nr:metallopeptidase family protein [Caulobacteraceae bacterium]
MSRPAADWSTATPPSLEDFAALAEAALAALPPEVLRLTGEVQMRVLDFAEDDVLDELGIEDAFQLTGLYQGPDLRTRSVWDPAPRPSMVFLYRRAILDEWCEHADVPLGELIAHVLVHEIGHHFGLSDADIERVEAGE